MWYSDISTLGSLDNDFKMLGEHSCAPYLLFWNWVLALGLLNMTFESISISSKLLFWKRGILNLENY